MAEDKKVKSNHTSKRTKNGQVKTDNVKKNTKKNSTNEASKKTVKKVDSVSKNKAEKPKKKVSTKNVKKEESVTTKKVTEKESVKEEVKVTEPKVEEKTETVKEVEVVEKKEPETVSVVDKKAEKKALKEQRKLEKKDLKKTKKRHLGLKIFLLVILLLAVAVVLYTFLFAFDASSTLNGDDKTKNGEISFEIELKGNKPIVSIYYAIDPEDESDKKNYTEIDASGFLFNKTVKFENLQIPVGKRKICIYVESYLLTHDVECKDIRFDLGYVNEFNTNNVVKINDNLEAVNDELLVTFGDGVSEKEIDELVERYNAEIVGKIYFINMYQIKFTSGGKSKLEFLVDKLSDEDIIENVSYNIVNSTSLSYTVNDEKYKDDDWNNEYPSGRNWYLELIEATDAWDLIKEPKKVNVGVIDNPINIHHEDLRISSDSIFYLPSTDFPKYEDVVDYINDHYKNDSFGNQHGTHVAGIIGALHNDIGVAGVGLNTNLYYSNNWIFDEKLWENVILGGSIEHSEDMASFIFALSNLVMSNCRVINMSFESNEFQNWDEYAGDPEIDNYIETIDNLFEKFDNAKRDFVITKAAGNENKDASGFFFNYVFKNAKNAEPHVLIVGAVDYLDTEDLDKEKDYELLYSKASFSNYGEYVDVFAPGVDIPSTSGKEDSYVLMSGTSQAAPIVAGIAELIYSVNPDLKYSDVIDMIRNSDGRAIDNNGMTGYIVNAKEAVQLAIDFEDIVPDREEPSYGYVQGTIVDASTDKPLDDKVKVTVVSTSDKNEVYYANTTLGGYDVILPVGEYNFTFKYDGYVTETIYKVEVSDEVVTYNVKLSVVNKKSEKGKATGYVKDAIVRNKTIPDATIEFYRGINNTGSDGEVAATVVSDKNGKYEVELDPGNYTAVVKAADYIKGNSYVVVISGKTKNNQDCTISPVLKEGEIRAVLTWGEYPYDLDSHLLGPTPDNKTFHVYYSDKNYDYNNENYDNLDVDDTSSYGPETVSVYKNVDGEYTYLVHDFTNRVRTSSTALANSSAQVKLYVSGKDEPYIFNVPNKEGTVWEVFKIDEDGKVIPINEMSYESDTKKVGS